MPALDHKNISNHPEAVIEIPVRDFEDMLEGAASRGARKALTEIGLDDEKAVKDINEIRSILEVWRDARKTALNTIVKLITTALLGFLTLGAAIKLGVIGDLKP